MVSYGISNTFLQKFFCKHRPLIIIDVSSDFGARGAMAPGSIDFTRIHTVDAVHIAYFWRLCTFWKWDLNPTAKSVHSWNWKLIFSLKSAFSGGFRECNSVDWQVCQIELWDSHCIPRPPKVPHPIVTSALPIPLFPGQRRVEGCSMAEWYPFEPGWKTTDKGPIQTPDFFLTSETDSAKNWLERMKKFLSCLKQRRELLTSIHHRSHCINTSSTSHLSQPRPRFLWTHSENPLTRNSPSTDDSPRAMSLLLKA